MRKICRCKKFYPAYHDVQLGAYKCFNCNGWKTDEAMVNLISPFYYETQTQSTNITATESALRQKVILNNLFCDSFTAQKEIYKLLDKNNSLREELQEEINDWLEGIL